MLGRLGVEQYLQIVRECDRHSAQQCRHPTSVAPSAFELHRLDITDDIGETGKMVSFDDYQAAADRLRTGISPDPEADSVMCDAFDRQPRATVTVANWWDLPVAASMWVADSADLECSG